VLNHIEARFIALRYFSIDDTYGAGHKEQARPSPDTALACGARACTPSGQKVQP